MFIQVIYTWIYNSSVKACIGNKYQIQDCDFMLRERRMGSGYGTKRTQLYVLSFFLKKDNVKQNKHGRILEFS